ncbi:MAG: hypothetical protein D6832_05435, partial [Alphaproteobacteria bacterium]
LFGLAGNDQIRGFGGDDMIFGGVGGDDIRGGGGADAIAGGAGSDSLRGGAGADVISVGAGHDLAAGGGGNDVILSGGGRNQLNGGDGDDVIVIASDAVRNSVKLGAGADTLKFTHVAGRTVVRDFVSGTDVIDLRDFNLGSAANALNYFTDTGADIKFTMPHVGTLILEGLGGAGVDFLLHDLLV